MARFKNDYAQDASRSMTFAPVMPDMTTATHTQKVWKGIRFFMARKPKGAERLNMGNGKLFYKLILGNTTFPTEVVVSHSGEIPLSLPRRAVIFAGAALPMRTRLGCEGGRKPRKATIIVTKFLSRLTRANGPLLPAHDAGIRDARLREMRVAPLRAIFTVPPRWWDAKRLQASGALQCDRHRAVYSVPPLHQLLSLENRLA